MRTDRRFCGQQCRLWWYRHRGTKRPDFPPGGDRHRLRLKKGLPKTFAEALAALADARAHAARLESAARQQQTLENQLRNDLFDVKAALIDARSKSRDELDALQDALDAEKKRAGELAERERAAAEQVDKLRKTQARDAEQAADTIRELTTQREQIVSLRDSLQRQNAELTHSRDELRRQLDLTEYRLSQRDAEYQQQLQNFAAVERAHTEVHAVAESESRSLRAEKERRVAAEQRVELLTRELERMASESQTVSHDDQVPLLGLRQDLLVAELKEVRQHRDDAIAERELLAARILKLMAPGQYLEHAAAAGYDLTKDPLIRLKREEVIVEHRLAAWQESRRKRRRARRLDPEQTLDEQAYAAALSFRWRQIDHPHLRRKQQPRWVAVGFMLDAESERYLLTLTEERIDEMKKKMEQAA